ncbi:PHP domain-containing protein [Paenibacillus sp. W2I17]|uniref:PHP domain-containing protein n=1 Tax=Paenibacillus sp. W2I17 TaxID=3042311 RepID=UPI002787F3C1|nr:PHP domain-containing protein [Paenibacillus sp. W2I17]MDQ0660598.1 putative metal-dependent phosphoesterase TrpH [Paenibacillus sp. W2I17]
MIKLYDQKKGSQWRKWDLHIHSTYSKESSAKLSIKKIFDEAISKGISVISVTDHSNVKSLDEIWEVYQSSFTTNDGVELKYKDFYKFYTRG